VTAEPDEVQARMPEAPVTEHPARAWSGWPALGIGLALVAAGAAVAGSSIGGAAKYAVPLIAAGAVMLAGLTPVSPGQARVVSLFGRYTGTVRAAGLRWVNPFTRRRAVSTRIRNHETAVDLDEERKAVMVSNLLVVLCSDHATQPVVNTGTLY